VEVSQIKSKFYMNSFDQNTYVVANKKEAIIIDAGAEIEDLERVVKNKKVLAVLVTHLHFDHIFNIENILEKYNCPVYIQEGYEEKFYSGKKNVSYIMGKELVFNVNEEKIKYYEDNLKIGKFKIEIIKTKGHSEDGVCIKIDDCLFTGDTIFENSIGRTDFYDSSDKEMEKSLNLIRNIDFKMAYPGHSNICSKNQILNTISFFIY